MESDSYQFIISYRRIIPLRCKNTQKMSCTSSRYSFLETKHIKKAR